MRKKVENCPPEMQNKREESLHKRPRQPTFDIPNKKLCRVFDSSHLIVYGETAESIRRDNEWLHENAEVAAIDEIRPRLQATAQERHERLRSLTISEALVLFPFLASEASLVVEFNILFKRDIVDDMGRGFQQLCDIILQHGDDTEVTVFQKQREKDVPLTPCLLQEENGEFSLYIDKENTLRAASLLGGMACHFASFWVFNIEYPKKACRLLTFIEHSFMGLSYTKPRVKALELINFFKAHVASVV
ncbi:hypothetical protein HPB50_027481 [Hyalomma asiaticum]|uniref:Uncharacterized protein n=1 Tax=Hyalomma asiaticum TaxID=266040 RepID=A0ACB7T9F5_HYAAI|nr:hypothetical protein HPB50_027481 [Hyalomma asiaticum]